MPGIPPGPDDAAWNLSDSSVIFNHGYDSKRLGWALQYPFKAGSTGWRAQRQLGGAIIRLVLSRLEGYAWSPAEPTPAATRAAFHDRPPFPLPGYTIRHNAYWPGGAAILMPVHGSSN